MIILNYTGKNVRLYSMKRRSISMIGESISRESTGSPISNFRLEAV